MQADREEYIHAVQKYSDMVYRIAIQSCGNHEDAEDIAQNVFLKLYLQKKPFREEEHRKRWLIRVTVNECHSLMRSPYRKRRSDLSDFTQEPMACFDDAEQSAIFDAVMDLPLKYRTVVYLYYYEEYQVKEIAEIIHVRETAIQTRLMRARKKMKEYLEKEKQERRGSNESGNQIRQSI